MSINENNTNEKTNNELVKEWKRFLIDEAQQKTYETTIRLAIDKTTGPTKHETYSKIRAAPGVTTVHVVPRYQPTKGKIEYETLEVRFCCTKEVNISPMAYLKNILRPAISAVPGVSVLRFVGKTVREV